MILERVMWKGQGFRPQNPSEEEKVLLGAVNQIGNHWVVCLLANGQNAPRATLLNSPFQHTTWNPSGQRRPRPALKPNAYMHKRVDPVAVLTFLNGV
jgi:hypothetical protein